ncbi:MAG TPA: CPBP family intramembrane glutamic endopeptidase [Vicinamibacteria bacterium]|jgi:membrane protease YdiL (CAAX protease family)
MHAPGSERTALPASVAVAAVVVGLLAMQVVTVLVVPRGLRLALAASEITLVLPGLLAAVAFGLPLARSLGLLPLERRAALLVCAAGATLWAFSLGLFELQYAVWAPPPGYLEAFQRLHEALRPAGPADALVSVAAIALLPALAEETLVRGLVLPALLARTGAAAAVVVSAALFAFIHLDPYRTPFTLVLGLALGWLRIRTGTLTACVVAHALLNTITFVAAPLTDDPSAGLPPPQPLLGATLFVLGGAASAWVMRLLSLTPPGPPPRLDP